MTTVDKRKVIIPKEVAEALEQAKVWSQGNIEVVAWCIPIKGEKGSDAEYWRVLLEYGDVNGGFFTLIDALRHGYEIEDPHAEKRKQLLENLAKIGYEGESAQIIVDTIFPIIFGTEHDRSG